MSSFIHWTEVSHKDLCGGRGGPPETWIGQAASLPSLGKLAFYF